MIRSSPDAFARGYSGGGPSFTHTALLRAALGIHYNETSPIAQAALAAAATDDEPGNQLWEAIWLFTFEGVGSARATPRVRVPVEGASVAGRWAAMIDAMSITPTPAIIARDAFYALRSKLGEDASPEQLLQLGMLAAQV
ncbi:hypothetical protein ACIA5G_30205 [Amycolatopsis sp. NPDC051758]|uniref:hypothetical protein n=1 Tax=Amycolatopsis sp. NPDC051758 TaxID=3363935 RepID=UPI00379EB53F